MRGDLVGRLLLSAPLDQLAELHLELTLSHFWIRRTILVSPTRCSMSWISHSWLIVSKNRTMSASRTQHTCRVFIPNASVSS
ncbi:MAG: hypothetical protein ACREVG_02200, partial [Burkholderiales bacterium]